MIYVGPNAVLTREQLREIPITERPDAGKVWAGVGHGQLADEIVAKVEDLGFKVTKETWYCNKSKSGLFGAINVSNHGSQYGLNIGQEAQLSLGVRHDNSGRYAVSIAVGATVMVCQNGAFFGDFVLKSRHTQTLNVKAMVDDGVERWLADTIDLEKFIQSMQKVKVADDMASHLIVSAGEGFGGVVPWQYLKHVLTEWHEPLHEEFKPRNLWSLYNCFTEVYKKLQVPVQMDALKRLKGLMDEVIC